MTKKSNQIQLAFGFALLLSSLFLTSSYAKEEHYVEGELVVKMQEGYTSRDRAQGKIQSILTSVLGRSGVKSIIPFATDETLYRIKLRQDEAVTRSISALMKDRAVKFAEPNYIYSSLEVPTEPPVQQPLFPNDAEFSRLWNMENKGQNDSEGAAGAAGSDIHITPLWKAGITGTHSTLAAVIDTGVNWTHPDLAANIYTNPSETADNGTDDDENGLVDDVHGWNFAANTNNSNDDNEHGSHCAGIIGAQGNNSVGVAGVNWNVSILPIKFLDRSGYGSMANAVESINYAKKMHARVINASWGGGSYSDIMKEAIEEAGREGVLFVAAAGNDGVSNESNPTYPASYALENIISVAAINNKSGIAYFSNFGLNVHLAAPGVNILSTILGEGYDSLSGTSMAAPHVAGVAALLLSAFPEMTPVEVKERLIKTSAPIRGYKRKVLSGGRIDAFNAYYNIIPESSEPDESLWQTVDKEIESAHPYQNGEDSQIEVQHAGAKYIRVIFEKIETENRYDQIRIEDEKGEVLESLSGDYTNYTSEYVEGEKLIIRLKTDSSITKWGYKIAKIQVIS